MALSEGAQNSMQHRTRKRPHPPSLLHSVTRILPSKQRQLNETLQWS